jgi:hypothetical protein
LATGASSTLATGQVLAGTGGLQVPGASSTGTSATKLVPVGVSIQISHINGLPRNGPALDDAQMIGYDPTANILIRFDAVTGAVLQTIPLPGTGSAADTVNIGRAFGHQVILFGAGSTVRAFDLTTGAPIGQFSTADLAPAINNVTGIALTESRTILVDATSAPAGMAQAINLTQSLETGKAVAVGSAFSPTRQLFLIGGATGVAGLPNAYFMAAAHFDTATPANFETGIATVSTAGGTLTEVSRTAFTSPKSIIPAGPPLPPPTQALGSINNDLALVTSAADGVNTVNLYVAQTLTPAGTLTLQYPNELTGLSEAFHPELAGTALINVSGPVNFFHTKDATGLVLNDRGFLNEIGATRLTLLSTYRLVGQRGGVTLNSSLRPQGPFELP